MDGDGSKLSISGGADAASFAIDGTTGNLRLKQSPDFEQPGDADGDNVYEVTVSVVDSGDLSDSQAISFTITDVNERPQLTSHDGNASVNLSVFENGVSVTTVSATDQDSGTTLAYSISGGVDASKFRVDESSGALSFRCSSRLRELGGQ